ncbi:alpha-amylase [Methylocystis sp. WRRC1]|uniref:alpha-amylase n=1 Tax=Methylocystis sp. WRRC1 TaxID=1732014 RepID=UPI001D15523B|nr:alpha-amylase [Methylocystis sp. WRRC1]MCC3245024.1 alpha-amylase [Methylocystis sp. WRRC1]
MRNNAIIDPQTIRRRSSIAAVAISVAATVIAASGEARADKVATKSSSAPAPATPSPPPPAPLGVFGADMAAAGKLVLSVIPQFANLSTSLIGTRPVSSQEIAATVPYFFNPTQKLRLVPQNAAVATQTVALAYGVTKELSVVFTAGMIERNLDMLTFRGLAGIIPRGMSYTGTAGLTDFTLSGIYRIYQDPIHRIQLNAGVTFPTGSNTNTFTLLQPDGTYATSRAFYAMQPGAGTFDFMPGVVYAGHLEKWSWGVSYRGRFPIAANRQGYLWGDLHEFNGWGGYTWIPGLTTTFRVNASIQGPIRGYDPNIRGRAQAANPNFYGGERIELFGGAVISGKFVGYENVTLAVEAGAPVYQNLNGPQLSKNWQAGMALRWKI